MIMQDPLNQLLEQVIEEQDSALSRLNMIKTNIDRTISFVSSTPFNHRQEVIRLLQNAKTIIQTALSGR